MDSGDNSYEAILFFSGQEVSREMLYQEFEALLDCVVPMLDFKGLIVDAAYVRFDNRLLISGVVLFKLTFDESGYVDRNWNVPIQMLAERAASGPDLGAGPIRLASQSQCAVPGQETMLWDLKSDTLQRITTRLAMNRLGLDISDSTRQQASRSTPAPVGAPISTAVAPAPAVPMSATVPVAPAYTSGDAAGAVLAIMEQNNAQMAVLREQHQHELVAMQERLSGLQQQLQSLENEKRLLIEQLNQQAENSESDRQATAARVAELQREMDASQASAIDEVRKQFEAQRVQLQRQCDEQIAAAETRVENAQRERQVAVDQLASLRGEITELSRDKRRLVDGGADQFFERLRAKNIQFVSFQPGAGHLTIAMDDLVAFLENSEKFVAEKCGVTVDHYLKWLRHYQNPVCIGAGASGAACAKPLQKQLKPAEFVVGLHDRCDIHKQVPRSQSPR